MADFTAPRGGDDGIQAGTFVNLVAAAVSVTLIAGVGIWGYKLLVRDVTGVPVVSALEGDMRIAPENPGGEIAAHLGLSVNSVPADGGAAEPEDRFVLAPSGVTLEAEDLEVALVAPTAEAGEVEPATQQAVVEPQTATLQTEDRLENATAASVIAPTGPRSAVDVLALADQIAAGAAPLADLSAGETAPIEVAVNGVIVDPNVIPDAVSGVRRSLRPNLRPEGRVVAAASATQAPTTTPIRGEVTTAPLAVGTKLVQLGAYDSADIAATEWVRFTATFPDFFATKERVIQEASSGGRTFFRLRAMGFADLSDARRFCAALSAQGSDCIPVVVR